MLDQFVVALLPIAAGCGWFYCDKTKSGRSDSAKTISSFEYFHGLNHMLNEEQDKAIEAFIKLIEVKQDRFETHLILGNLFRRTGDATRAIRVHKNLILRFDLPLPTRMMAYVELIKDYMDAGVLDRAEQLCLELVEKGEVNSEILSLLLRVYQTERKWLKAIEVARQLEGLYQFQISKDISHYYAEIGYEMYQLGQYHKMSDYFFKALDVNQNCVRVHYLQVLVNIKRKDFFSIIDSCKYLERYAPDLLCYLFQLCFDNRESMEADVYHDIISYIDSVIATYPYLFFLLTSQSLSDVSYLSEQTLKSVYHFNRNNQSLERVHYFLCYQQLNSVGDANLQAMNLREIVNELITKNLFHRCGYCGFKQHELFWCCKGCHRWGSASQRVLLVNGANVKES